ncbi:MAG: DUF3127 domain-containing protein [Bacteroidales bacterium]|nr:DUF3127 domain-containing protein [Bacteroidales bacterium]
MALEIEGKLKVILPMREGDNARGHWTSQEFVIDIPGQFERVACFSVFNNRVDINSIAVGENIKVSFDISGREYQGRYYNSLNAWKIEKVGYGAPAAAPAPAAAAAAPSGPVEQTQAGGDDLPF